MKLHPALVLIVAALATPAVFAAAFEGKIRMKATSGRGTPQQFEYSVRGDLCRIDFDGAEGRSGAMIMDARKQEMTILMPEQHMYMTRSILAVNPAVARASDSRDDIKLEKTGERTKILGYDCVKYLATGRDGTAEIWATDELGRFMGLGSGGPFGNHASHLGPWEKALMGKDFFPLRIVSHSAKEHFQLEVVSVQKESIPSTAFEPPAGYQKFDLGGMMRGMMPGAGR